MKHRRRAGSCSRDVELQGPLDVPASVEGFRRWGDDLLDRWDGATLVRTLPLDETERRTVAYACTPVGTVEQPRVRVAVEDAADRAHG